MTIDIAFANILMYLLVWVRLAGMILFNPLLARRNIPAMARNGLVLFLTLLIAPMQGAEVAAAVYQLSGLGYALALVGEMFIGLCYGFIFQIFYYLLFFVGDLMDGDMGISMAKTFDPATNIQTAFSSSLLTLMFTLFLFVSGSHLVLIRLFANSFNNITVGTFSLNRDIAGFILELFVTAFNLVLRLAAPIMVAEFALQGAMGILMKFVPQITVFVINFQLRILLGILMLLLFMPFFGQFIDTYIDALFGSLLNAGTALGPV